MPIVSIPQFHSKPTDETKEGGFHVVERNECLGKETPQVLVSQEAAKMLETVQQILICGDDAEVRRTKNGGYKVIKVIKTVIEIK